MLSYLELLSELHRVLEPRSYLEVGVRHGKSLELASCPAVGVDPVPELTVELGPARPRLPDDVRRLLRGR